MAERGERSRGEERRVLGCCSCWKKGGLWEQLSPAALGFSPGWELLLLAPPPARLRGDAGSPYKERGELVGLGGEHRTGAEGSPPHISIPAPTSLPTQTAQNTPKISSWAGKPPPSPPK